MRLTRFEHRSYPLLSRRHFLSRLATNLSVGMLLIVLSLFGGMLGYHFLEEHSWVDSFANAAMILSGMGPLGELRTFEGKIFGGLYALYSGLALIVIVGVMAAPLIHRILHKFHIEEESNNSRRPEAKKNKNKGPLK